MDISALSDEQFNAADWINAQFKKYVEEAEKDNAEKDEVAAAFCAKTAAKLQLYVQQLNFAIEETSTQLDIPQVLRDTRALAAEMQQLKKQMSSMRAGVDGGGECMATLERLNKEQSKLQAAKESLQESDGWGNLIAEMEEGFERNDLRAACAKLVALQKSLLAQEQLPGHGERQSQVEDFKNRLEALASPSVVQCFAEANVEQARRHVAIFEGIQRLPQLYSYYRAVQKNALQQQWKQTLELQATESTAQQQHFLALYYDQVLEHCQRQVKWCAQVFGDGGGADQAFVVVAELLPALQPTRDAHILQLFRTSNQRLELLELCAQANHTFATHLNAFSEQCGIALSPDMRNQLGEAIYEYFGKFIQQYPRLEETQLSARIDRLIVNQATASEAVRHLDDSNRKVFDWLAEARRRCASVTSDLALCKLIALLGSIFRRVLENFSKTQRQLSLSITGGGSENWSMLQYTISMLQCLADFQVRLSKLEKTLHAGISALAEQLGSVHKTHAISIYESYDRTERKRLLASIAEYQQKRTDATDSQVFGMGIFTPTYEVLKVHYSDTHDITLNILLQPIEMHLTNIQPPSESGGGGGHLPSIAAAADMPAFGFAPQECITQIGQYLLTLPQHLEPLLLSPSALLKQALESCNIKYTQNIPCADILLSLVVEQCCALYQSQILQLKSLPAAAAKQLAVDIEYLSNVVEELGLSISLHLGQILTLLKAAPETYLTLSSGCEPRLVTAIRQMRNIISTQ